MNGVNLEGTVLIIFGYLNLIFYIVMALLVLYLVILSIKALRIYIKERK